MYTTARSARTQWLERTRPKPMTLFLQMVFVYVALQAFAFAFESGLFRLMSNAFALWLFGVALVNTLFLMPSHDRGGAPTIGLGLVLGFGLYYMGMGGNLILLRGNNDLQDWAKIFMAPAFLLFGFVFASRKEQDVLASPLNRLLFWLLVLLPIAVWGLQLAMGRTSLGGGQTVGTFVNRNNASLYYLTLIAFYACLGQRQISNVLVYLLAGMAFGTLGVLLAVLLSLMISVGKPRYLPHLLLVAVLACVLAFALPQEWVLARLERVLLSYRLLMEGRINLRTVTYAELVQMLGTSDLSFIFRLKHWVDLWDLYVAGTPYQQLFGFGVGASVLRSEMHLVPHNDYVRYLFECGAISLAGFVTILWVSMRTIGRTWGAVPLLGVVIYFFSENLINNTLAMTIFYFSLGSAVFRAREARAQARQEASLSRTTPASPVPLV